MKKLMFLGLVLIWGYNMAQISNKSHCIHKGCVVQYNSLAQMCFGRDTSTYIVKDTVWNSVPEYCTPCIQKTNFYIQIGDFSYVDSTLLIHKCKK